MSLFPANSIGMCYFTSYHLFIGGAVDKASMPRFGGNMRRLIALLCLAVVLSGCAAAPEQQRNALLGAGVGAGVGALIGSAAGGPPGGWAGAAIGAATGGVIGYLIRPEGCYFRNARGELWQDPCEEARTRAEACFYGRGPDGIEQVECPYVKRRRGA